MYKLLQSKGNAFLIKVLFPNKLHCVHEILQIVEHCAILADHGWSLLP